MLNKPKQTTRRQHIIQSNKIVVELSQIRFDEEEFNLLNLRPKYAFEKPQKSYFSN